MDEMAEQQKAVLPMLYGDNIRLKQLLINLVRNALCASGITRVRACYDDFKRLLKVQVTYSGKTTYSKKYKHFDKQDMPVDCIEDKSSIEEVKNGLTLSKLLVEQLGGEIEVYSAGQGLTTLIEFTMSMKKNQEDVTPQIEEEKIVEATIDDQYSRDTSRQTSVHA